MIDKSIDGILGIDLRHRQTDLCFVVFSCYLPPENSPWGRDAETFFSHILAQIYLHCDMDAIFLLGDFNSRIGHLNDFNFEFDNVCERTTIDGKSPDIDLLHYEVFKNNSIKSVLHKLYQLCFKTGKVPSVWGKAIIHPIPKGTQLGQRISLNYHDISLFSVVAKCYSSVLNNRLQNFLEEKDSIVDKQNGFGKDRSCLDHVFTLNSMIQNRKSNFVTFIDLQKAFDFVDCNLLQYMYKLKLNGIDGYMYNAISSLYVNTESCVCVNGFQTNWFPCVNGVRQGDNISLTLFSIFINEFAVKIKNLKMGIPVEYEKISILLYADDIALVTENERNMQVVPDILNKWCEKWRHK